MSSPGKNEITDRVYSLLPDPTCSREQALLFWWVNIRSRGGMRLTPAGFCAFKEVELESWSIDIDRDEFTKRFIVDLDRRLTCPYFIFRNKIHLFGSQQAVMALLHGNMTRYLGSLQSG